MSALQHDIAYEIGLEYSEYSTGYGTHSSMSLFASVLPAPESPLTMTDWLRRVST